jgi:hypothetical protein
MSLILKHSRDDGRDLSDRLGLGKQAIIPLVNLTFEKYHRFTLHPARDDLEPLAPQLYIGLAS